MKKHRHSQKLAAMVVFGFFLNFFPAPLMAQAMDPSLSYAQNMLDQAVLYLRNGHQKEAAAILEKLLDDPATSKNHFVWLARGWQKYQAGDLTATAAAVDWAATLGNLFGWLPGWADKFLREYRIHVGLVRVANAPAQPTKVAIPTATPFFNRTRDMLYKSLIPKGGTVAEVLIGGGKRVFHVPVWSYQFSGKVVAVTHEGVDVDYADLVPPSQPPAVPEVALPPVAKKALTPAVASFCRALEVCRQGAINDQARVGCCAAMVLVWDQGTTAATCEECAAARQEGGE